MAKFKYVAIDSKGKTLPGEIAANDAKQARQKIRQKGLTPLQIKSVSGGGLEKDKKKTKKINYRKNFPKEKFLKKSFKKIFKN